MKNFIELIFEVFAIGFDKIPFMQKLAGYRSVIGLLALAVVKILAMNNLIPADLANQVSVGLVAWIGLALNSKGR